MIPNRYLARAPHPAGGQPISDSLARSIAIEKTTLRTGDDVREWAKRAESQLLEEVKKGPVLVS